jgi:hypothetical protein
MFTVAVTWNSPLLVAYCYTKHIIMKSLVTGTGYSAGLQSIQNYSKCYKTAPIHTHTHTHKHTHTHTHTHTFGGLLSLKETKPVVQFVYPAWQLTYIKNSTNNELDCFSFLNLFSSAKNSILFVFIFWISNIPDHQTPTWVRFPYIFILQYLQ